MATIFDYSMTPDTSTDAKFRAVGQWFGDKLRTFGFAQTSDTGQINWATVLRPAGNSVFVGYEVFAATDALSASAPFVLKVEYGSSDFTNSAPQFRISVGSRTNGAGVLLAGEGAPTVLMPVISYLTTSTWVWGTTPQSYFTGDSGRFSCVLWANHNNHNGIPYFSVERTKDALGNDTDVGLLLRWGRGIGNSANPVPSSFFFPLQDPRSRSGGMGVVTKFDLLLPNLTQTTIHGAHPTVSAPVQWFEGMLNPGLDLLVGLRSEFSVPTPTTITRYGFREIPYVALPNPNLTSFDRGATNTHCLLLRWE